MPAALTGFLGRARRVWSQFSLPQRTIAILAVAVLALGSAGLYRWAATPTMAPVFSGLSAEDANAVVDQLVAEGVPYELADGGSTVLVPREQLYDLRISLAASGVPTAEGGYSLLDNMGMASSDFQQQVTYQRALEGELASTVQAIDGVTAATVHLALPEASVFVEETAQPTASVFVQLEQGSALDAGAVQGIINLVSSAVPNMTAAGVSVIDAEGQVLSASGTGGASAASDHEQGVTASVQAMLDRVVGPGNAVVSVKAEFSSDTTERVTETFTPAEGTPPLSQSTSSEKYTGTGQAVGGVLGPDNIAVPGSGGAGNYASEESVVNNPVNKVTEQTTVNPGGVARQSVSVVVDAQAGAGLSLGELERIVTAAAGLDLARGDQVAVSRMAFDTSAADSAAAALAAAEQQAASDRRMALIQQFVGVGVALLLAVLVAVAIRRSWKGRREEIDLRELPVLNAPWEALPDEVDRSSLDPARETALLPASPSPAALEAESARAEIASMAAADPGAVADRMRDWLAVRR